MYYEAMFKVIYKMSLMCPTGCTFAFYCKELPINAFCIMIGSFHNELGVWIKLQTHKPEIFAKSMCSAFLLYGCITNLVVKMYCWPPQPVGGFHPSSQGILLSNCLQFRLVGKVPPDMWVDHKDHSPKIFVQVQALSCGLYDVYVLLVCKTNAGLGQSWMSSLAMPICHDEAGYIDTDMCHTQAMLYAKSSL